MRRKLINKNGIFWTKKWGLVQCVVTKTFPFPQRNSIYIRMHWGKIASERQHVIHITSKPFTYDTSCTLLQNRSKLSHLSEFSFLLYLPRIWAIRKSTKIFGLDGLSDLRGRFTTMQIDSNQLLNLNGLNQSCWPQWPRRPFWLWIILHRIHISLWPPVASMTSEVVFLVTWFNLKCL